MTPAEKLALSLHAPAIQAQNTLKRIGGELNHEQLHDLVLLATGSKDQAEEAATQRAREEIEVAKARSE